MMNESTPEQSKIAHPGLVERILQAGGAAVKGVLLFGSAARGEADHADLDLGIVYEGHSFELDGGQLDLFFWSKKRWESGFALQLELARDALILYDPEGILLARLEDLRKNILPHWQIHLRRI